ncbi:hypothetical protein Adt_26726 [Abeliophyllum distichum]|uniref:Uncharacterized protein n=1 Tax=Abeliophyllum distichum TaxID=126358 RepID=A0ABD1RRX6_9LAMI
MLKFYEHIIGNLLEDHSGLVIFFGGLGLSKLISSTSTIPPKAPSSPRYLSFPKLFYFPHLPKYPKSYISISTSEINFDLPALQCISLSMTPVESSSIMMTTQHQVGNACIEVARERERRR